jgi:ATP-dependent exoDNAse (exonuclease V) alpha subunit
MEGKVQTREFQVDCCVSDRHIKSKMAVGERVKFTQNDYRRGYTNGTLATIVGIEKLLDGDIEFEISTDSNRKIRFKASEYCNDHGHVYLTQAYALTIYASQGLTVDGDVFVYYNSGMDRAHTYVAGSRHKDNCHFFMNTKELSELVKPVHLQLSSNEQQLQTLADLMASENRKRLAIEYIDKQQTELYKGLPAIKLERNLEPELV